MLREIVIENYYISAPNSDLNNKSNNINKNSDILDIDISPNNNHVFLGHKFNMKKEGYGLEIYSDINARFFVLSLFDIQYRKFILLFRRIFK